MQCAMLLLSSLAGRQPQGQAPGPRVVAPARADALRQGHVRQMLRALIPWVYPTGPAIAAALNGTFEDDEYRLDEACRCCLAVRF